MKLAENRSGWSHARGGRQTVLGLAMGGGERPSAVLTSNQVRDKSDSAGLSLHWTEMPQRGECQHVGCADD